MLIPSTMDSLPLCDSEKFVYNMQLCQGSLHAKMREDTKKNSKGNNETHKKSMKLITSLALRGDDNGGSDIASYYVHDMEDDTGI